MSTDSQNIADQPINQDQQNKRSRLRHVAKQLLKKSIIAITLLGNAITVIQFFDGLW